MKILGWSLLVRIKILTLLGVGMLFFTIRRETTRTSHKPLTDKLHQATTSCIDKPTGSNQNRIKPKLNKPILAAINQHLSLQRCLLHIGKPSTDASGIFVFIEFNILIFIMICRQKRKKVIITYQICTISCWVMMPLP